ncbi:MAG: flagellar biosynthetic protein FliP [Planctomycetota bacterium]
MKTRQWTPAVRTSADGNRGVRFTYARLDRTASTRPKPRADLVAPPWWQRLRELFGRNLRRWSIGTATLAVVTLIPTVAMAQGLQDYDPLSRENLSVSLKMLSILTLLTLAPSILLLTTAFPRIVIVLGFVRRALSTQEVPPNQVIVGLSLILTFFVMGPTFTAIKDEALVPYINGMNDAEALDIGVGHLRNFMWKHVDPESLDVMIELSMEEEIDYQELTLAEVPLFTLVPAFVLSELKRAFEMGSW